MRNNQVYTNTSHVPVCLSSAASRKCLVNGFFVSMARFVMCLEVS